MRNTGIITALCLLACLSVASADYTDNVVAQWTFEGNTDDSAGNVNNAITLGTGATLEDGSLLFTGISAAATFDNVGEVAFGPGQSFTVWARVYRTAIGNPNRSFHDTRVVGVSGVQFFENDAGTQPLRARTGTGSTWLSSLTTTPNVWQEVAMVYEYLEGDDAVQVSLYLDGTMLANPSLFPDVTGIGAAVSTLGHSGSGTLAGSETYFEELRIYNAALTTEQLDSIQYYVPEPATLGLLLAGSGVAMIRRRRK